MSDQGDISLAQEIADAFRDSAEPATKRDVAIVLAGLVSAMEAIQSSYLALSYDPRTEEGKSKALRFENSMNDLFATVRQGIKALGEDSDRQ